VSEQVVRAAGGVPLRRSPRVEVAVVHRPHYDDWSFPKGKCDPGETDEAAALRELEEETGLVGRLGRELSAAHYRDHRGRPKIVRYWCIEVDGAPLPASAPNDPAFTPNDPAFTPNDPAFTPNDEVDELRWLTPAEAAGLLSYDHDRRLLEELEPWGDDGP
jgi:8-oxo-dGTP diphosphatase